MVLSILRICAMKRQFSTPESRYNKTDPLEFALPTFGVLRELDPCSGKVQPLLFIEEAGGLGG
jgi:hypothetical protein